MFSKLKYGGTYLYQFLINFAVIIIIIFIVVDFPTNLVISVIVISSGILLYSVIIKRYNSDLARVREIINNISGQTYQSLNQISLPKDMKALENDIRKMYLKISSDIEYLKKLERIRSEFIANVSHELKTPIFTIQGYLETLLNGAIDDEKVRINFLTKANNYTLTLSRLVNDLIDLSLIEAGEMRMSFRYFRINDFIRNILIDFETRARDKNIELNFIPAGNKLELYGDKDRIRQVMTNLLSNALKYTDHGSIEILVEEESSAGKIIVRDTGIGIPEADLPRIFERFYRVDKARSREEGGTGLGLSISKHIIEAHGSHLEVKSIQNKGSEFSFKLKK